MSYCCAEHQSTHHSIHKADCSNIAKKSKLLNHEDEKLRNFPGDVITEEYPLLTASVTSGESMKLVTTCVPALESLKL
jgi:hypothetical protein